MRMHKNSFILTMSCHVLPRFSCVFDGLEGKSSHEAGDKLPCAPPAAPPAANASSSAVPSLKARTAAAAAAAAQSSSSSYPSEMRHGRRLKRPLKAWFSHDLAMFYPEQDLSGACASAPAWRPASRAAGPAGKPFSSAARPACMAASAAACLRVQAALSTWGTS